MEKRTLTRKMQSDALFASFRQERKEMVLKSNIFRLMPIKAVRSSQIGKFYSDGLAFHGLRIGERIVIRAKTQNAVVIRIVAWNCYFSAACGTLGFFSDHIKRRFDFGAARFACKTCKTIFVLHVVPHFTVA
jgi:hypothetical protein